MKVRKYSFEEATATNPYFDRLHYGAVVRGSHIGRDADGRVLFVFMKGVIPTKALEAAATVLKRAPTKADMRAKSSGGAPPLSGIAGYYDYMGTPQPEKCRKTAFTRDMLDTWPAVYPLIEYVNAAYHAALPGPWKAQNAAIPDPVRIRKSVFSTLTINAQFRTASHTDAGDFDEGYGALTSLEGSWKGVMLGFPGTRVCIDVQPGDLLLFNTHVRHANTEVEVPESEFKRLTVVFYYRYRLGEEMCLERYKNAWKKRVKNKNGTNVNREAVVRVPRLTLFSFLSGWGEGVPAARDVVARMAAKAEALAAKDVLDVREHAEETEEEAEAREAGYLPQREKLIAEAEIDRAAERDKKRQIRAAERAEKAKRAPKILVYNGGYARPLYDEIELDAKKAAPTCLDTFPEDSESLTDSYSTALVEEWCERLTEWTSLLGELFRTAAAVHGKAAGMSWKNTGAAQDAFTKLCDVATALCEARHDVSSMDELENIVKRDWWVGYATFIQWYLRTKCKVPQTFVGAHKLDVKLRDYEFGGTRYTTEETRKRRSERLVPLRELKTAEAVAQTKSLQERSKYQTEDEDVDYTELGLADPRDQVPNMVTEIPLKVSARGKNVDDAVLRVLVWTHARQNAGKAVTKRDLRGTRLQLLSAQFPELCSGLPPSNVSGSGSEASGSESSSDNILPYRRRARGLRSPRAKRQRRAQRINFTYDAPTAAKTRRENFDLVCVVGMASCVSENVLARELAAARDVLCRGGLVLIKDYGAGPVDHARLTPDAREERVAELAELRRLLSKYHGVKVKRPWTPDELELWIEQQPGYAQGPGPTAASSCGVFQVSNSILAEFFLAFAPTEH